MTIRADCVELVHRQLEILKYAGSWKTQTAKGRPLDVPTGQGIDVGIVLLPDLVMDIREEAITRPGSQRTCAVGGRAARCACALLHLLDDYDGTFWVRLLTRTGNLGRLLLKNEFHKTPSEKVAEALLRDTVLDDNDEPRYALLTPTRIRTNADTAKELGTADFEKNRLLAATMRNARVVCLSSIIAQRRQTGEVLQG